jgi:filamentous hemagglutinin family protein
VTLGVKGVEAQPITPAADGTGTVVTSPKNNPNQFDIEGGTLSGTNLFHSLEQFGLSQNQIANFISNPNIHNILSRVVGGDTSVINGLIMVTGGNSNLYLLNPAGIILGPDARLNVPASFTATTANGVQIGDYWFQAMGSNNYAELVGTPNGLAFTTNESGVVFNASNLAVSPGESIALVGGTVVNTGTLSTPGGNITIGAVPGKQLVRISQEGNLLSLDLPVETEARLNGATQPLTPLSLPQLLRGENLNQPMGVVVEDDQVKLAASGTVIPNQPGTAIVSGKLDASNISGTGGTVNVVGDRVGVIGANVNASGVNGGGRVLVGGDYQGQGMMPNAQRTYVSGDSVINADALTNGHGGVVIIWADGTTGFYGNVSAGGGSESGDGGFVEVSGKQNLIFRGNVDVSASNGILGILLLDPQNIRIVNGDGGGNDSQLTRDNQILAGDNPGETFTISENSLESQRGNVRLEATNDITIEDLSDDELTLQADSIIFIADADNNGSGSFVMDNPKILVVGTDNSGIDTINTNGGDLTIQGASITAGGINTIPPFLPETALNGGAVKLTATVGNIVVRLIFTSTNSDQPSQAGDVTITANHLFRATGGGINAIGFFDFDKNESDTNFGGGQISITHGGTDFVTGASAENPVEGIFDSLEIIPIDNFSFTDGSSGTLGAIISGSRNGNLRTIYVDTGLNSTPGLTPRININFSPPSNNGGSSMNGVSNNTSAINAAKTIESQENSSRGSVCNSSNSENTDDTCTPSNDADDEILDVSNVIPPNQSE